MTFPDPDEADELPVGPGGPGGPPGPDPPGLEPLEPLELDPSKLTRVGSVTPVESMELPGEPVPTCPLSFCPQHFMVPSSNAAHVCSLPSDISVAVRPVPRSTVAGRFPAGGKYDPVPSCP